MVVGVLPRKVLGKRVAGVSITFPVFSAKTMLVGGSNYISRVFCKKPMLVGAGSKMRVVGWENVGVGGATRFAGLCRPRVHAWCCERVFRNFRRFFVCRFNLTCTEVQKTIVARLENVAGKVACAFCSRFCTTRRLSGSTRPAPTLSHCVCFIFLSVLGSESRSTCFSQLPQKLYPPHQKLRWNHHRVTPSIVAEIAREVRFAVFRVRKMTFHTVSLRARGAGLSDFGDRSAANGASVGV